MVVTNWRGGCCSRGPSAAAGPARSIVVAGAESGPNRRATGGAR